MALRRPRVRVPLGPLCRKTLRSVKMLWVFVFMNINKKTSTMSSKPSISESEIGESLAGTRGAPQVELAW